MALLTVDDLREHIETALSDTALTRILEGCEFALAQWAGPLVIDAYELTVEDVAETISAPGQTLLPLRQVPTAITSVTDTIGVTDTLLGPADNRIESIRGRPYLRRLGRRTWGERTTVVHTPTDDSPIRRLALIGMCGLEVNYQPGMASQGAGPWSETYGKYLRQWNEYLRMVRPADSLTPRSVPYTRTCPRHPHGCPGWHSWWDD